MKRMNKIKTFFKDKYLFLIFLNLFFVIIVIGMMFNTLAVASNGGKMPVYNLNINTNEHFGFTDKEIVNDFQLTDKYRISNMYFSIGDLVMFTSAFFMVLLSIFKIVYIYKK